MVTSLVRVNRKLMLMLPHLGGDDGVGPLLGVGIDSQPDEERVSDVEEHHVFLNEVDLAEVEDFFH